jgi:four helix bundle protein
MDSKSNTNYNLDKRTFVFAQKVRDYVDKLPRKMTQIEIGKQLVRSAGSVRANYIEANEALSKRDFLMRIKICKKEAKESRYWLKLSIPNSDNADLKSHLIGESTELIKIFATIVNRVKL